MSDVGQQERATQNRVVKLFQNQLGYSYLGNWENGERTMPVEDRLLCDYLAHRYDGDLIQKALTKFYKALALGEGKNLYEANKAVYDHLRYGVKVKKGVGEQTATVWLIDWKHPLKNDFSIAEEDGYAENPDGDTLDNLAEYGLGGAPDNPNDAPGIVPTFENLEYVYRRRTDATSRGLLYTLEESTNLISNDWNVVTNPPTGTAPLEPGFEAVTNQMPTTETNQFIRLRILIE